MTADVGLAHSMFLFSRDRVLQVRSAIYHLCVFCPSCCGDKDFDLLQAVTI